MSKSIRWQRRCLLPSTCIVAVFFFLIFAQDEERVSRDDYRISRPREIPEVSCRDLPSANDTVVVLRTGSTEIADKLPVHLSTTLRCYPNYLILSDHKKTFQGEEIVDALDSVSAEVQQHHPDFELHRRVKHSGRSTLQASELSGIDSERIEWTGKVEDPGWKLDKWKFVPMITRTYHEYPDMKWYVFVEADSYIFWRSTLQYLNSLDHTRHHYSGSGMYIGDDLVAHGGSGFFVSQAAVQTVVNFYTAHQQEIKDATDKHWAGDCIL